MREADLTIVGNGAVACAIALVVAQDRPDTKVLLVGPQARPGSASLAAGAMLNVFAEVEPGALDNPVSKAKLDAGVRASREWKSHLARLNGNVAIARGTYVLSHAEIDHELDAIVTALKAYSEPFREVNPAPFGARRVLFLEDEGAVHSRDLHRAYDEAFAHLPNVTVMNDVVTAIERGVVRTKSEKIASRDIVLAAGARTQTFVEALGLRTPRIRHGGGTALVVSTRAAPTHVLRATGDIVFAVPYGPGRAYLGSTTHLADDAHPLPATDPDHLIRQAATRLNPGFEGATIDKILTGYRPWAEDGLPLIGHTSIDGIWLASGTRRDGFHLSPLIAKELATSLISRDQPFAGAFRPER